CPEVVLVSRIAIKSVQLAVEVSQHDNGVAQLRLLFDPIFQDQGLRLEGTAIVTRGNWCAILLHVTHWVEAKARASRLEVDVKKFDGLGPDRELQGNPGSRRSVLRCAGLHTHLDKS